MPPDTPVTTPEVEPIVATDVVPAIQVPPVEVVLSVVVNPSQAYNVPVIGLGVGLTVATLVTGVHPVMEYEIIVVPGTIEVTTPEKVSMVAIVVLLLVHVPPETVLVSVVDTLGHNTAEPPIAEGGGTTLMLENVLQPVGNVYTMFEVPPEIPVTTPEVIPMLAMPGEVLLHVPPEEALVKPVVDPTQTIPEPLIVAGIGLTESVILYVLVQPDVLFLIVIKPLYTAAGSAADKFTLITPAGSGENTVTGMGPAGTHESVY